MTKARGRRYKPETVAVLGQRFNEISIKCAAATKKAERLFRTYRKQAPLRSKALIIRSADIALLSRRLKHLDAACVGRIFLNEEVESLRKSPLHKQVERLAGPKDSLPEGDLIIEYVPWKKAQLRANEIMKAHDEWWRRDQVALTESGCLVAEYTEERMDRRRMELARAIARIPARTVEEILIKARIAAWAGGPISARQLDTLDEAMVWSLVKDLCQGDCPGGATPPKTRRTAAAQ